MKKLIRTAVVAMIILLAGSVTFAQEWTKEQTEVWKVVQDNWMNWKTGDVDGFASYLHDVYHGG